LRIASLVVGGAVVFGVRQWEYFGQSTR
jgi:hypothetical protein